MKKNLLLISLCIVIALLFTSYQSTPNFYTENKRPRISHTPRISPTNTLLPSPTATPEPTLTPIPAIGVPISPLYLDYVPDLPALSSRLYSTDILAARMWDANLFLEMSQQGRLLIFGKLDDGFPDNVPAAIANVLSVAEMYNVTLLGYNLEILPGSDIVPRLAVIREELDRQGNTLPLIVGPTYGFFLALYREMSPYVEGYAVQLQTRTPGTEGQLAQDAIVKAKSVMESPIMWFQLSCTTSSPMTRTVEQIVSSVQALDALDGVTGIDLYMQTPGDWDGVCGQAFDILRPKLAYKNSSLSMISYLPTRTLRPTRTPTVTPPPNPSIPVIFGVETLTIAKYPDYQQQLAGLLEYTNMMLGNSGIVKQFFVDSFSTYDKSVVTTCVAKEPAGGYLPEEYCSHPGNIVFIAVDETNSKNYPYRTGPSVEFHGVIESGFPPGSPHYLFIPDALAVFTHELGHILGLPDLYLLRVAGADNYVNGESFPGTYNPWLSDIMNDALHGVFSAWDKEIVDRENPTLPAKYNTWYDYQPANTILQIKDSNGNVLSGVSVSVYSHARTPEHKMVIDNIPEYQGLTDANGLFSLGSNVLGTIRYDSVKVFLIEIVYNGQPYYQWFNFMDVNYAFWNSTNISLNFSVVP